jgi:hypothetical protein
MPLTKLLPPPLAAAQFQQTFTWGKQYLQPSSRILGALLLLTTFLTSRLSDPAQAAKWRDWALCLGILAPVAPYEVYTIFHLNDRVEEIGDEVRRGVGSEAERKAELGVLLGKWQVRNFGRVAIPLCAGLVGLWSMIKEA